MIAAMDDTRAAGIVSDIVDPTAPQRTLDEVYARYGGLDVLVLNAGGPTPGRILDVDDARWQADFDLLRLWLG